MSAFPFGGHSNSSGAAVTPTSFSGSDTQPATPIIEITAEASTDATSLILMDRLGHKYPFSYDAEAKAWRVHYRVPLKTEVDRLGLSVTATSGTNRFKRVWVFLKIQGGVPAESDGC